MGQESEIKNDGGRGEAMNDEKNACIHQPLRLISVAKHRVPSGTPSADLSSNFSLFTVHFPYYYYSILLRLFDN